MAIEKVGFVGGGKMAGAMIGGMRGISASIAVSDPVGPKTDALYFTSNVELAAWADLIIFAVKPQHMPEAMADVAPVIQGKPIVSIAAGIGTQVLLNSLPGARVLRAMPNTPALLGVGMSVLSQAHTLEREEYLFVRNMFASIGDVADIQEDLMAAATALSGSGPAYFYLMIEAMADEGVRLGIPRALAYRLAAQTAVGSGMMVKETGKHPGELKDDVCSPMGTTIAAINALEHAGARAAMMDAVNAAYLRAKELG